MLFKTFAPAALLAALTVAGCATRPAAAVPDTFASSRAEAQVAGLSCPLCAESLLAVVEDVEGVESAWLDLDAGRLTLEFATPAPKPQAIADAIEKAGFTLQGFGPVTK